MPEILLVYPEFEIESKNLSDNAYPVLGLNYLASALKERSYDVAVLDALSFSYMFTQKSKVNMSYALDTLVNKETRIVGFTMLTYNRSRVLTLARKAKSINKEIKTIVGGPHASIFPNQILEHYGAYIDYVVIGEGEKIFPQLADAIMTGSNVTGISGIGYKDKNGCVVVKLPKPSDFSSTDNVSTIDYDKYRQLSPSKKIATFSIMTGKGCPYCCSFCSLLSRKQRLFSLESIVTHVTKLVTDYGMQHLRIQDDTFGQNREHSVSLLKRLASLPFDFDITFANTRVDIIDEEFAELYKAAGGKAMYLGVESGSQKVLDQIYKKITIRQVKIATKILKQKGIKVGYYLVFGTPGESLEDIGLTFQLLKEMQPDEVWAMVMKVLPGSQIYEQMKKKGSLSDNVWLNLERRFLTYATDEKLSNAIAATELVNKKYANGIRTAYETIPQMLRIRGIEKSKKMLESML